MAKASKRAGPRRRAVYVVDGARTPFLKARNQPGPFRAADLAVQCGRALLLRQPFEPNVIDEVILGCIMPGPDEANIGRVVALRLGCGHGVPAWTVQRNCASGMQAVDSARRAIADGHADLVLAGGTEAMSHAPVLLNEDAVTALGHFFAARTLGSRLRAVSEFRPRHLKPLFALLKGLTDPVVNLSMGQTAEVLAGHFQISREEMDRFAAESHQRLAAAQQEGRLGEITPVFDSAGNSYPQDDGVRADSTPERLAKLRPVFDRPFGQVTAGNSAQITDGASWLLLASEAAMKQHGLSARARLVDGAWAGLDPAQMGLGPAYAMAPLLKEHRLTVNSIDYWEINEAFAAQVLACLAAWTDRSWCRDNLGWSRAVGEIPRDRLNVDGGAVALGHPVGTSGARIVLHLINVLEANEARRGIASLCIGGGQGGAMLVER